MYIPRSQYLDLAGVDLGAFKPLTARNQVPYLSRTDEDKDHEGYAPVDSLMLATANAVFEVTGHDRDAVKLLVQAWWHEALALMELHLAGVEPWLLVTNHLGSGELLAGSFSDLVERVSSDYDGEYQDGFLGFTLVPMVGVVQHAATRADALGISFGELNERGRLVPKGA